VVGVEGAPLEQVTKQLNKLINVIKVVELEPDQAVQRDHMLIKVKTDATTRSQVLEAVTLFRARVIDVVSDAVIIEVTGDTAKCAALIRVLEPFGIKELVQSGVLAMSRGSKSMTEKFSNKLQRLPAERASACKCKKSTNKEKSWQKSFMTKTPIYQSFRVAR
jgi:acetolactate synthase-1/3 small subunit